MPDIDRSVLRDEETSGFQVLAGALPRMIEAMARPGRPPAGQRLGGITHAVARHLRAEICSIFLLEESSEGRKLVLEEAYGYQPEAIGTAKNLDTGLTARIVTEPADLAANFRVQDHPGWEGQLDGLLQGHCWCLLGVPIIGADRTKVKGAIEAHFVWSASITVDRQCATMACFIAASFGSVSVIPVSAEMPRVPKKPICTLISGRVCGRPTRAMDSRRK